VTAVSYGESSHLADNATLAGRQKNRRVEILVYREAITNSSGKAAPHAEAEERAQRVAAAFIGGE